MPINDQLIEILCCPKTKVRVKAADQTLVEKVNAGIAEKAVKQEDGTVVEEPLQEALVTEDGARLYRIHDNIPVMLVEQGIPLDQVS